MTKTTTLDRTFRDSIVPSVYLKPEESCSLKRHYRNILREVIGWLDHKANLDPERFVAFTVPSLTKACNRYKTHEPYKQRQVEYAVAFLRDERAVSGPLERVRNGRARRGVIVAPHDGRFGRSRKNNSICVHDWPRGKWKSSGPGGTVWWEKS